MANRKSRPVVLVLTSTFPRWTGDTEPPFVFELCRRLATHFEVHVLAPHAPGAARIEQREGIQIHRYRYWIESFQTLAYEGGILSRLKNNPLRYLLIPPFLIAQTIALRHLLRSLPVRVVHAHWIIPQGLCAVLARRGTMPALLCTSHGGDLYGLRQSLLQRIKRYVLERCDAITVVSSAMARDLQNLAPFAPVPDVIPMGTDLQHMFVPGDPAQRQERTLLFAGRLVEKKGVDVLLRAFARVLDRHPDARLLIAGAGPNEAALRVLAAELALTRSVEFLGAVSHERLVGLFTTATVTVVPSVVAVGGDQEGFGLVIVEALGCGCPVIASDLPAIRQTIDDGRTGLMTPPRDPAQLAQRICALLTDPQLRQELAQRGRDFVLQCYDWEAIAERYRIVLESLIVDPRVNIQDTNRRSSTSSNKAR